MKDFCPQQWPLSQRILATVAYFDIFELPMTAEILPKLIFGERNFTPMEMDAAIATLEDRLDFYEEYICLKGRVSICKSQSKAHKLKEKLIERARNLVWIFRACPFIENIAICNYLSLGIVDESSDIDLLTITKHGRIYTGRFFMTLLTQLFDVRRHADKVEGRFCLSFYLNRHFLDLESLLIKPDDIYMAYWVLALLPIYGEKKVIKEIHQVNEIWMRKYFQDLDLRYFDYIDQGHSKNVFGRVLEWILGGRLGNWFEAQLEDFFVERHRERMKFLPKNASVEVSRMRQKFHNNDKRLFFLSLFEERLKGLKLI